MIKTAFDEHVPVAIAKVFFGLANERRFRLATEGICLERAKDYAPTPGDVDYKRRNDVPWLDRFAAAGGAAVISGGVRMRERPHEMLASYQHGFVVIFFDRSTGGWDFFHKSALLLHWWEQVVAKIKNADTGTFWAIPTAYPIVDKELRNVSLGLAELLKDRAPKADQLPRVPRPERPTTAAKTSIEQRQGSFAEELGGGATPTNPELSRQMPDD